MTAVLNPPAPGIQCPGPCTEEPVNGFLPKPPVSFKKAGLDPVVVESLS
jgi:hypothetical protein